MSKKPTESSTLFTNFPYIKIMKKLNITLLCISVLNLSTNAQEFAPEETGETIAANFVDASNDPATNIVLEAQETLPNVEQNLSIDDDLNTVLKQMEIKEGWDAQRQMMVIKHVKRVIH